MNAQSPWPERDDTLRALWAQGLPTLAIAERMGLTKGQVVGRAHRLNLEARPSPIKAPSKPRCLRSAAEPGHAPPIGPIRGDTLAALAKPEPVAPRRAVTVRALAVALPWRAVPIPPAKSCCWPMGEPRTEGFRFCEAAVELGRSYCETHHRRAYQPRKPILDRSEAQAEATKAYMARGAAIRGATVRAIHLMDVR